jgi:hypothetical protein
MYSVLLEAVEWVGTDRGPGCDSSLRRAPVMAAVSMNWANSKVLVTTVTFAEVGS